MITYAVPNCAFSHVADNPMNICTAQMNTFHGTELPSVCFRYVIYVQDYFTVSRNHMQCDTTGLFSRVVCHQNKVIYVALL